MKNFLFISSLLISISSTNLFAQNFKIQLPPGYNKIITQEELPGKEGSPYLTEVWAPGIITLQSGAKIESLQFRYNVYSKEIQYKLDTTTYVIGTPDSIKTISFANKHFIYTDFVENFKIKKDFFELLVDGKAKLFRRYFIEIIPANYNIALSTGNKNDRLVLRESLFVQSPNMDMIELDKKGKLILKAFSDKSAEINEYIRKEHLSLKNLNDLIKITTTYNSMN
ncbi:MAG: hypothetical protein Q8928_11110 [Bacteroidota bacterium]|nr:hypothetical protein [Bacteroidota bacterium]